MTMTHEQAAPPQSLPPPTVETSLEQRRVTQTAVTTRLDHGGVVRPTTMGELIEFAKMVAYSGMVPKDYVGNPGACIVAIQMGAELGLSPMAALQNIAVINGRPCLWGDAGLAIVKTHRDFVDITETSGDGWAKCVIKRRGQSDVEHTFSQADAVKAKLWEKAGPWTQYPKRMLQMRARWFSMRDQFPDALRGIQAAEEVIDMPHVASPFPQPIGAVAPPAPVLAAVPSPSTEQAKASESAAKIVQAFESIGISKEMLVAKIGREPDGLDAQQVEWLRGLHAEVKNNPKRKFELFGAPPSAAADINKRFGAAAQADAPDQPPSDNGAPRQTKVTSEAGF